MANIEKQYLKLLKDVLDNGTIKSDRTGTGTKSVFGRQIRHDMSKGFPLLTTKKMYWKGIVTELLWFLRGDTNIKYLVDNDCHIWDGDAYKNYINISSSQKTYSLRPEYQFQKDEFINKIKTDDEFAKKWGDLGPVYGKQWRSWNNYFWEHSGNEPYGEGGNHLMNPPIDQISNLIEQLKTNPDSRRLMVNAWNVGELDQMTLPPCHYGFQVYTRELSIKERIVEYEKRGYIKNIDPLDLVPERSVSLMWSQRSVDTFLGLPFNIASYALLLEIIAKEVDMIPGELVGNLGDVHLYLNHIEQAREQMTREPKRLPKLVIANNTTWNGNIDDMLGSCIIEDFQVERYDPHNKIVAPLSN
jgi:thymidylate synthase